MYRASVKASIEESSLSSVTRESERQASLTTRAVHTVCEDLSTSAVDAVNAVNGYVEAVNNGGDTAAKAAPRSTASTAAPIWSAPVCPTRCLRIFTPP